MTLLSPSSRLSHQMYSKEHSQLPTRSSTLVHSSRVTCGLGRTRRATISLLVLPLRRPRLLVPVPRYPLRVGRRGRCM